MFDVGKTEPICLYDLAVKLADVLSPVTIDPNSELYSALQAVVNSVWGQLPPKIVIEFPPDD